MISILLTLLKIIGIVLLSLLGLLLVLLLIVLFVPVRYRIKGYYKEEFVCHLKATWLLHLVSLTLDFDKEVLTSFRIFGMDISSFINKAKNRTTSSPKTKAKPVTQQTKAETEAESQKEIKTDAPEENHNESHSLKHSSEPVTQEEDTADSSAHSGGKTTIRDRILSIYQSVCGFIHKIKQIFANIANAKESLERYIRILQREDVKGAFALCKKRLLKMIKHILPKHTRIYAHIGMEDPATTGYILAAYSVLPDTFRKKIILQAEFDKVILEGDFTIKGSCNAIRFIYEILCIVTDKNCRTFYKLVKKEMANERK